GPKELLRLLEGRCHRLLDENVRARLEQVSRHVEVALRRHRHRGEVDLPLELVVAAERANAVLRRHGVGLGAIDVHDAHQLHAPQLREGEDMVLPHVAGSDDGGADAGFARSDHDAVSSLGASPTGADPPRTIPRLDVSMNITNSATRGWSP